MFYFEGRYYAIYYSSQSVDRKFIFETPQLFKSLHKIASSGQNRWLWKIPDLLLLYWMFVWFKSMQSNFFHRPSTIVIFTSMVSNYSGGKSSKQDLSVWDMAHLVGPGVILITLSADRLPLPSDGDEDQDKFPFFDWKATGSAGSSSLSLDCSSFVLCSHPLHLTLDLTSSNASLLHVSFLVSSPFHQCQWRCPKEAYYSYKKGILIEINVAIVYDSDNVIFAHVTDMKPSHHSWLMNASLIFTLF